jgi:Uma2 family endonuclease
LLFPVQGSWTEEDYLQLDASRLIEFSEGSIEVLPMPTKLHQRIVRFLFLLFDQFVRSKKLGEVLFSPLPVRLWPDKYREPDILYLRSGRGEYRGRPEGADLVVEVVSEGEEHRRRDLEIKPPEYARAGIAEYWIVDPEKHQIVVLALEGDAYREHGVFGVEERATSFLLSGFDVSVRDVFAAGR